MAIPTPTFFGGTHRARGDAPDAACFSPEGDALVGVFDGGMRATWRVPVGPRGHTWTLRKVTFDADRDVLALAVADGGGVGKIRFTRGATDARGGVDPRENKPPERVERIERVERVERVGRRRCHR